jgi:class 3 adenylate cyclase
MARTGFSRPLGLAGRINVVVVTTLVVGLGLVAYLFAANLTSTRQNLVDSNLRRESDILYLSIENFMLPGEAPIAVNFFEDVAGLGAGYKLGLYRSDGSAAFADDTTISRVNMNLGRERFPLRLSASGLPPMGAPDADTFKRATSIPPESVFFAFKEDGRSFKRVYRPLLNLPKCTGCHGSDHTIRGVLDIRADITEIVQAETTTIIASAGGFVLIAITLASVIGSILRSLVVGPVRAIGKLCIDVTGGDFSGRVDVKREDEIGGLANTVNNMVQGLRERYELTKYVSAGTITSLASSQEPKRVERTLLFTDVRGFTTYTERHGAEAILGVLNGMLEEQATIITAHGGDIDKFVGDEVVAVFAGNDAPDRAVQAAMAIQAAVASRAARFDNLAVGAGIATGQVVQGMVGSSKRADFTVLGDAVNIASRLCSLAKAGQILVCDCTRDRLAPGSFKMTGPYKARLKGKTETQTVFMVGVPGSSGKGMEAGNEA